MSGVYWGLTALAILDTGLEDNDSHIVSENGSNVTTTDRNLIEWVLSCQDSESGGYKSINSIKNCTLLILYVI